MRKHTHHNHWDLNQCACRETEHEGMLQELHSNYLHLKSTVLDLLQSLEAEDMLKNGFNGMGYNIVTETASKRRGHIRRIKEMIGED